MYHNLYDSLFLIWKKDSVILAKFTPQKNSQQFLYYLLLYLQSYTNFHSLFFKYLISNSFIFANQILSY